MLLNGEGETPDIELTLARLCFNEAAPNEVDALVAWMYKTNPQGLAIQHLHGICPIAHRIGKDDLEAALLEAGLVSHSSVQAAIVLARREMCRIVSGDVGPQMGASAIEDLIDLAGFDHDIYSQIPEIWNFCDHLSYLRAARKAGDDAWYDEIARQVIAEAEFHLGMGGRTPDK